MQPLRSFTYLGPQRVIHKNKQINQRQRINLPPQIELRRQETVIDRFKQTLFADIHQLSSPASVFDYHQLATKTQLWEKPVSELVQIYSYLNKWEGASYSREINKEILKLAFEVRDCLIRQTYNNAQLGAEAARLAADMPELAADIKRANPAQDIFIPTSQLKDGTFKTIFDRRPAARESSPRALHVSIEYEKAMAGGVGGVAQSLLLKMNEAHMDARIVTPFYDLYRGDDAFKNAKFVGIVDHELNGRPLKSSIYKVLGKGNVPHYVLKPDPSYPKLFDIKESNNVYSTINGGSSVCERQIYFASAVAAMGAAYRGRNQKKHFDIVHFHTWTTTFGAHVMKNKYLPFREKAGLPPIHPVQHFHHGSLADHTIRSADIYKQLGLTDVPAGVTQASTQEDIWLHIDGLVFVSPVNAANSLDPAKGTGLHPVARHLHKHGRMTAVMNGIDWKAHSLTSQQAHGSLALRQTLDSEGNDITDFAGHKRKIKKALFDQGIVGDPEKPLFLYVGRYSPEKGIDKLPGMVEEIVKNGGQCVIMGWGEGGHVPAEIQALQKMQKKYSQSLRVYTTPKDQLEQFLQSGATKGNLIRGASEFLLMPSKFEGNALVVWEALARGSLVISSQGGGLKAQCFDLNDVGEQRFNAFGYDNEQNADVNSRHAIQRAMAYYHDKIQDPEQWNAVLRRMFAESKRNDWLYQGGPVEQIKNFYNKLVKTKSTPQEQAERERLIKAYYNKFNPSAPQSPAPDSSSDPEQAAEANPAASSAGSNQLPVIAGPPSGNPPSSPAAPALNGKGGPANPQPQIAQAVAVPANKPGVSKAEASIGKASKRKKTDRKVKFFASGFFAAIGGVFTNVKKLILRKVKCLHR